MAAATHRHRGSGAALLLAVLAQGASSGPAGAATATATFTVSATVQATCVISASALAFATYVGLLATATSTLSITCTNTTPYNVGLSAGTASGATVTSRQMTAGAVTLAYTLTSDAAHTVNWGQTIGTDTVAGTGNGTIQVLTVYGQIGAGLFITPGSYTDTIIATVTY
jgi:spore coat protein U-like protein